MMVWNSGAGSGTCPLTNNLLNNLLNNLMTDQNPSLRRFDHLGIVVAIACAAHCMAAPVLLVLAPALGGVWSHPASHAGIAVLVLPVAALALRRGILQHGRLWIVALGIAGVALVLVGALLPIVDSPDPLPNASAASAPVDTCCPSVEIAPDTGTWSLHVPLASVVSLLGGIALLGAHFGNIRCCRICRAGGEDPSNPPVDGTDPGH